MHISKLFRNFATDFKKHPIMEQKTYTIDELRASVEEGTRQIERGQYFTDAQVNRMLENHRRQLA